MTTIKLTKVEQAIVDELLRLMYLRWVPSRKCVAAEIVGGWKATTKAERKALWRLGERGLLEVAVVQNWHYYVKTAKPHEAYTVYDFLPAFWAYVGINPKEMLLTRLQAEIDLLVRNSCNSYIHDNYPNWPLPAWKVESYNHLRRYHHLDDESAVEIWRLEWQRVAQNKALTEWEIQALEQEIAAIQNCSIAPLTLGSALWD